MIHAPNIFAGLFLVFLLGCTTAQNAASSSHDPMNVVRLDKALFFSSADGQSLRIAPGEYRINTAGDDLLRLTLLNDQSSVTVAANKQGHDLPVSSPFVVTFAKEADQQHILLLMEDGTVWETIGSATGIVTRDPLKKTRFYHVPYTLDPVLGRVQFGDAVAGQRPLAGSSVPSGYRTGTGRAGNDSAGELAMLQLQHLMYQRQTEAQLVSNVLQALTEAFPLEQDSNRPGGDYAERAAFTAEQCRTACAADSACLTLTFVKPLLAGSNGQCFLKRTMPARVSDRCCVSAQRKSTQQQVIGNIR